MTPIYDTGLLDYLFNNSKCYQGKYQEDGSMLVTPLKRVPTVGGGSYWFQPSAYLDGTLLEEKVDDPFDYFTVIPTIYYKSAEISPDKFKITFSIYPFEGCHKVFGEDNLIGFGGGTYYNDRFYSNLSCDERVRISFTTAREAIEKRGKGYYGFTSDEMGVLMFLNIYNDGVNGNVLSIYNTFLGVLAKWSNGGPYRNYIPNIEIENGVAKVTHLDNSVEVLDIPYIWGEHVKKYYIGEYLTLIPKEKGKGVFNSNASWIGNAEGTGIYLPNQPYWSISGDRTDTSIKDGIVLKIRPCFKGRIVETEDVDYFKSVPIIN